MNLYKEIKTLLLSSFFCVGAFHSNTSTYVPFSRRFLSYHITYQHFTQKQLRCSREWGNVLKINILQNSLVLGRNKLKMSTLEMIYFSV